MASPTLRSLRVLNCGTQLVRYSDGLKAQEMLVEQQKISGGQDTLLLLQVNNYLRHRV